MKYADVDTNGKIAALLRDLAAVQTQKVSRWGYVGAAAAVFSLEYPIESLVSANGTLAKIPNVGPKSETVILEVLQSGESPTVERAVSESPKRANVEAMRGLRSRFFSRAQVAAILADPHLSGVSLDNYLGDFQMHSTFSDGSQTLEDIVRTGIERGYRHSAVTDHSHGLRVARGMSTSEVTEQHAAIDALNEKYAGRFRLLKGIEANIDAEGGIDLTGDDLQRLEMVLVAPHTALRTEEDQTERMIAAVRTPGVHVLAHPRGRQYGNRAGIIADWTEICSAAAFSNVAVELDGDPARQDFDYEIARLAMATGCLFAVDSDAHATAELRYAETAMAHARVAGIPADRVINCWPLDRLMAWLADR